ncbi:hypothetical protein T03_15214 [Trichinella britovi]|uniref:Uncharacterized protein n=1 Tax=Trichinella britovi TaxID=45882 RepID=A0A0V1CCU4_TRIBR|nr:hypothetical protein T03_15214 [Trichinella britovi]
MANYECNNSYIQSLRLTTVTQYYHDIELLMIYWETYMVKPFATLNTMISAVSLRTVQRPCVLDCRKCPRELRKLLDKYHYV